MLAAMAALLSCSLGPYAVYAESHAVFTARRYA